MKNNVVKLPETLDQAWNRLDKELNRDIAKHEFEIKRVNWFSAGFLFGVAVCLSSGLASYYFFGIR